MRTPTTILTGLIMIFLLALTSCDAHRINEEANREGTDPHGTNHVDRPTDANGVGGMPAGTDSTSTDTIGLK